jgi:murein DD-endopeptidase MepM/ murein hydrolase activator NlpD
VTRLRTTVVACATLVLLCLTAAAPPASFGVAPGTKRPVVGDAPTPNDPAYGTYAWPIVGPVINGYRPPSSPYGPGHRGIDIAAPIGTPVKAAADGVVAFAGSVGGSLYVSIDHPDGVRTTYSFLSSIAVHRGDAVAEGDVVGTSGHGHPSIQIDHLHFGARFDGGYINPLLLLRPSDIGALIRLAPLLGPAMLGRVGR